MRSLSLGRRHLVNADEVEASIGVIAGNTVIHAWAPWVWGTTKSALYKYTYLYLNLGFSELLMQQKGVSDFRKLFWKPAFQKFRSTLCHTKNEPIWQFRQAWTDFDHLGKQHQHTFRNYMHILLCLFLHFYLLYLLLNSWDGNDATPAMWSIEMWSSASLNMGKHITKCHWRKKQLINGKSG